MRFGYWSAAATLLVFLFVVAGSGFGEESDSDVSRTGRGLLVLYDFPSAEGRVVKDRSGAGKPLDLYIADPKTVRRSEGSLEVRGKTIIRSEKAASKINDAIRKSGALTVEVWLRPAETNLTGPARIVTLSKSPNERNFTLGQDGDRYDARFRTTRTSTNGIPSLPAKKRTVAQRLTHVVYTHHRSGRTRIYVNGQRNVERKIAGPTSNWDGSVQFALANELSNDRPWRGTYFLVAVYNRELSSEEVQQNFKAGRGAPTSLATKERTDNQLFERQIAPILARQCLDCHDSRMKKGGLDLSRKAAALTGGESGKAVLPGKAGESPLWTLVESGEMPKGGRPLSDSQKGALKKWIDSGAGWSIDFIDPANYAHQGGSAIYVQRLTVSEYIETVRSTLGVDVAKDARRVLPRDLRADGFSNTAYNLNVDLKHVDAYAQLAEIIVSRMDVVKFASQFSKGRRLTDDDMRGLIETMGKWILRGPLDDEDIAVYRGISTTVASAGGNYREAVSLIIEAMLQSPRFIYRVERQRGDGTPWPLGDYELASRLSYILWGGPPDKELMRAAEAGELSDERRLQSQVQRMLKDPRVVTRSSQFIAEWLNLGRLENLKPDRRRFPSWDPALASDMRNETLAFFKEVAWTQHRPLADLLNAQVTFATARLAKHYGLKPRGKGQELVRYDLSSVPGRGGLLTQGSVLTVGGDEASMVSRGLFVLHDLLRGTVKDPPPCVDTTPVPTRRGRTQRAIAQARIANTACGGCHGKFEPLAFGLEKFDGLGAFFEKDKHGNALRDDGEILFPGEPRPVKYTSSEELMNLLAGSDRVKECLTWKVTQFSLGRPLAAADAASVAEIHKTAHKNGGTYSALITAIVLSDLVRMTRTEAADEPDG